MTLPHCRCWALPAASPQAAVPAAVRGAQPGLLARFVQALTSSFGGMSGNSGDEDEDKDNDARGGGGGSGGAASSGGGGRMLQVWFGLSGH